MVKTAGAETGPRALRPLNGPQPIRVEADGDGHPKQVNTRGGWGSVEAIADLWRIEDEWWRERPISRSYYDVRLADGRKFESKRRWFALDGQPVHWNEEHTGSKYAVVAYQ